jgi:hypothetical protein
MPSISPQFLVQNFQVNLNKYPIFIESGTYEGKTIFAMENYFEKLYTVEVTKYYYDMVYNKNKPKISFLLGDTEEIFPILLPTIEEPAIFFLDGHYSGCYTGYGSQKVPLLSELTIIANNFKPNAIIIIDDCRLFETEDWEHVNKKDVISRVASRINKLYYLPSELDKNDRMIIFINAMY